MWHSLVASATEEIFEERLASFELKYATELPREVTYIKEFWLGSYKQKIVKAWVDRHLHFGNVVTSR